MSIYAEESQKRVEQDRFQKAQSLLNIAFERPVIFGNTSQGYAPVKEGDTLFSFNAHDAEQESMTLNRMLTAFNKQFLIYADSFENETVFANPEFLYRLEQFRSNFNSELYVLLGNEEKIHPAFLKTLQQLQTGIWCEVNIKTAPAGLKNAFADVCTKNIEVLAIGHGKSKRVVEYTTEWWHNQASKTFNSDIAGSFVKVGPGVASFRLDTQEKFKEEKIYKDRASLKDVFEGNANISDMLFKKSELVTKPVEGAYDRAEKWREIFFKVWNNPEMTREPKPELLLTKKSPPDPAPATPAEP